MKKVSFYLITIITCLTMAGGATTNTYERIFSIPSFIVGFLILIYFNRIHKVIITLGFFFCVFIMAVKLTSSPIYYPSVGKELVANEPLCLIKSQSERRYFARYDYEESKCKNSERETIPMNKGEKVKLTSFEINNSATPERYFAILESAVGTIVYSADRGHRLFLLEGRDFKIVNPFFRPFTVFVLFPFFLISPIGFYKVRKTYNLKPQINI